MITDSSLIAFIAVVFIVAILWIIFPHWFPVVHLPGLTIGEK